MPAEKLILPEATVLHLIPTGERFTQVKLISPSIGVLSLLKRNQTKTKGFAIDLFDHGEAHVDHKPGEGSNNGFLTDFCVSKKRSGLGKSYRNLQAASWLSGLLLRNPMHDEMGAEVFALSERALDALSEAAPPNATKLKMLYVFARDEGYPVLEDWVSKLSPSLTETVRIILNTPLKEIELDSETQQSAFASLAHYVQYNTHIQLPET